MISIKKISVLLLCFVFLQTANAAWTKQNSGTFAWLHSIYFVNEKQGWITGSNGTFLKTSDGGLTWKQTKKFTEDNLRDVYFSDAQNGWLLCERDIYGGGEFSPSYLLKTSDGGETWEKITVTGESRERITRFFFSKDGNGFAVGEAGAIWAMTDDKKIWKKTSLPVRYLMLDGKFADNTHGALVGGGGTILFTEDDGLSWNPAAVSGGNIGKLNSIFFINQRIGWTVGASGKILFTNNGGKFWHEQNSNISKNLSDIFFINTAEGWATGDDGTILHTTTAGNIWNAEETGITHKLERVVFVGQKGFAVGFGGTILNYDRTQNGEPLKGKPRLQKRTAE
ncbi:MAG: WD40/YVTN/BNR-like repeat-containing protein [Pyrinomonadaceae bacterium]